jgi:YaiO family outer membrane protein
VIAHALACFCIVAAGTVPAAAANLAPAIAAREAGDWTRAIGLLERADRETPGDPTILRLLGTSQAFARRHDEAIATLTRARSIAPRDQDIALALSRAYLWAGRTSAAADLAAIIAREDPDNVELPALTRAIGRARSAGQGVSARPLVAVSQSIAGVRIGGATRHWYATTATVAAPVSQRASISMDIEREQRSPVVDLRGQLRLDRRFGAGTAYVSASVTPDADFREHWGVRAGGEVPVAPMLMLTGELRYADYGTTRIVAAEPGIRLRSKADRWSIALRSINLWDELDGHRHGWAIRGEAQARPALRLIGGGATYPDTEAGVTRRLRSAFGGAILTVSDSVVLRLTYEHEDRRDSYVRDIGSLGFSVRF